MGANVFDDLIEDKIYPIYGDLTEPNIGLSAADFEVIKSQTNVIFHCAGNVDGNERIEASVKVTKKENFYFSDKMREAYKKSIILGIRAIHLVHFNFWI